jgi:uncharacterized protein YkwD
MYSSMGDRDRRREFLVGVGTVLAAGLAGCSEEIAESTSDDPQTTETTPEGASTPTATGGGGDGGSETPSPSEPQEPQSTPRSQEETPTPTPEESYYVPFSRIGFEAELRRQINEFRAENGESELSYDELYREATRQHSEVMATAGEASLSIDGRSASERAGSKTNCYADSTVARLVRPENRGRAAERIVRQWAANDESRTKMLKSFHNRIGVGAVIRDGAVYVTASYC